MPAPAGSCPACGRPIGRKDRICTGCGHDLRSGAQTSTTIRKARAPTSPVLWVWDNLLGMFGCMFLTIGIAAAAFFLARGNPDLIELYMLAVLAATVVTLLLIMVAIAREDGIGGVLSLLYRDWFWWSDSTDGRLKGVLAGLVVAGLLLLPLRASVAHGPGSSAATPATPGRP